MSTEERAARRRYLMFIEYNGNDFSGSQRQREGVRTVQEACETALAEMTKEVHSPTLQDLDHLHFTTLCPLGS